MTAERAPGASERPGTQEPMACEAVEQFLRQPNVAVLSWVTPKGDVASSPIWYEYRDGKFSLATSSAFLKARSMVKNPAVSLCVQDPAPPYRYVTIRATARVHADPEAARALDARLARHYLGRIGGRYYTATVSPTAPGEGRLVELTPTRVSSFDGGAGINPVALMAMRAIRAVGL